MSSDILNRARLAIAIASCMTGSAVSAPPGYDLDADGCITAFDLGLLFRDWGACPDACPADLNGDGRVDATDLVAVLHQLAAAETRVGAGRIVRYTIPLRVKSGVHDGTSESHSIVPLGAASDPHARWLRVHVGDYDLGASSFLLFRSVRDGHEQRLNARRLPHWYNTSAVFNGDAVEIELHVAPGDRGVFATLDELIGFKQVTVPGDADGPIQISICGNVDDRVPSSDPRVARMLGGTTATGWLVSNGAVLTAGHAGQPDGNFFGIIEFNVPMSDPNGTPNCGSPNDQYPINVGSIQFEANGSGEDWAVFRVNPNGNGDVAHVVQGFFRMTTLVPVPDTTMRVTGYGLDPFPPGTGGPGATCCNWDGDGCTFDCNQWSLSQQTATGRFDELSGTTLEYEVDTLPANSGSPVIWESTGFTVGIHTQGGCDDFLQGFENHGTHFGHSPLNAALENFNPPNVRYADSQSLSPFQVGSVFHPFKSLALGVAISPSGSTFYILPGSYPASEGNTFVAGADGKSFMFTAPLGTVTIGN